MNSNTASSAPRERTSAPRRISPPSTLGKKRNSRGNHQHQQQRHSSSSSHNKRQKFGHDNSSTANNGTGSYNNSYSISSEQQPMDLEPIFPKLNQSDPVHARRIQQRRKTVAMGKNTLGYAAYTTQVPKHKRRTRSMDTPGTPDHTVNIPTKRWQGMVKAWRKALHQYDPPDLVSNTTAADESPEQAKATDTEENKNDNNIQSRQIEHAIAKGLLVDVSTPPPAGRKTAGNLVCSVRGDDGEGSPFSVLSENSPTGRRPNIMDDLEADSAGLAAADDVRWGDDDDSDDDLL